MKVLMSPRVRALKRDPNAARALRDFIATAKLNEPREIRASDPRGPGELRFKVKLVPSQG
jgi:hypothetical protein